MLIVTNTCPVHYIWHLHLSNKLKNIRENTFKGILPLKIDTNLNFSTRVVYLYRWWMSILRRTLAMVMVLAWHWSHTTITRVTRARHELNLRIVTMWIHHPWWKVLMRSICATTGDCSCFTVATNTVFVIGMDQGFIKRMSNLILWISLTTSKLYIRERLKK